MLLLVLLSLEENSKLLSLLENTLSSLHQARFSTLKSYCPLVCTMVQLSLSCSLGKPFLCL